MLAKADLYILITGFILLEKASPIAIAVSLLWFAKVNVVVQGFPDRPVHGEKMNIVFKKEENIYTTSWFFKLRLLASDGCWGKWWLFTIKKLKSIINNYLIRRNFLIHPVISFFNPLVVCTCVISHIWWFSGYTTLLIPNLILLC